MKILLLSIAIFFLYACISKNDSQRPSIHYSESFQSASVDRDPVADAQWWRTFKSIPLNELIQSADLNNLDIRMAEERVRQAELQLRIANASLFPEFDVSASSSARRAQEPGDDNATASKSTNLNLGVSYEVDLWGGIAAGRESARASATATRYDKDATALSIKASIATTWFQWLALQQRINTGNDNIAIAERILKIVDARYRNGVATAAELAQQKTNLLTQQAALFPLELQAKQMSAALAILVGQTPQEFELMNDNLFALEIPNIAAGTPADLVMRRPDLAANEASLVAANADIVQTRAALLPRINLGASAGQTATELFRLNPATQTSGWSITLVQTLFNGGRLVNQTRYSESRLAELLLQYHKNILIALQEVDNAIASAEVGLTQEQSQQAVFTQAQLSLRLAEARYREGGGDLLSLLDAQRSVFQAQDALVQQRLARLSAAVGLYKALGGGWELQR